VTMVGMSTIPPNVALVLAFYPLGRKSNKQTQKHKQNKTQT